MIALAIVMVLGSSQAAFATSQYYHFHNNVPRTGWLSSSYKTLPANTNFTTTLNSCVATNGSSEGSKGVLMKPVRSNGTQYSYKTVLPGEARKLLLGSVGYSRSIRIDLQAVGTSAVDCTGYWYF